MFAWRLARGRFAENPLTGAGARVHGGRWNPRGVPLVYASEHLSLAVLELLVHTDADLWPTDLRAVRLAIPDETPMDEITLDRLPNDWRAARPHETLRGLGAEWVRRGETAVCRVPSAVVPLERNVLINPAHAAAAKIRVLDTSAFVLDPRLTSKRAPRRF